jgi:hypothetical protein
MRSLWDWLPSGLFALAVVCFGCAGYAYFSQDPGPRLVIPEAERALVLSAGEARELVFELRNTGRHPVRVVGLTEC